jgi:hypothetical protein
VTALPRAVVVSRQKMPAQVLVVVVIKVRAQSLQVLLQLVEEMVTVQRQTTKQTSSRPRVWS